MSNIFLKLFLINAFLFISQGFIFESVAESTLEIQANEGKEYVSIDPAELLKEWFNVSTEEQDIIMQTLFLRRETTLEELRNLAQYGEKNEYKFLACRLLGKARDKQAESALIVALRTTDIDVQEQAIQALRFVGGVDAAQVIRSTLENATSNRIIRAGLAALGELDFQENIPIILPFLNHEKESVRITAAVALAMLGSEAGSTQIQSSLQSTLPYAQRAAVLALGYFQSADDLPLLESFANQVGIPGSDEARIALVLRQIRASADSKNALTLLINQAQSNDEIAAEWAIKRLAEDGSPEALNALKTMAAASGIGSTEARNALLYTQGIVVQDAAKNIDIKHEIDSIHEELFRFAYQTLQDNDPFTAAFYDETACLELNAGSRDEDLQTCDNTKCYTSPYCTSPNRHFYTPLTGEGLAHMNRVASCEKGQQKTAVASVLEHLEWASQAYSQGRYYEYNEAFHLIGQIVHLLSDMTSPAHVHLDNHVISNNLQIGDDFEAWCKQWFDTNHNINAFLGGSLLPYVPSDGSLTKLMHNLALFTFNLTAFHGVLVQDPELQQEVNALESNKLAQMFTLEYRDGVEEQQPPGWWLSVPGFGHDLIFTPPNKSSEDEWWPAEGTYKQIDILGTTAIDARFYLENIVVGDIELTPKFFDVERLTNTTYTPGDGLCSIYARELFPECVKYVAGFLSILPKYLDPVYSLLFNGTDVMPQVRSSIQPVLGPIGDITVIVRSELPVTDIKVYLDGVDLEGMVQGNSFSGQIVVNYLLDGPSVLNIFVFLEDGVALTKDIPFIIDSTRPPVMDTSNGAWVPIPGGCLSSAGIGLFPKVLRYFPWLGVPTQGCVF